MELPSKLAIVGGYMQPLAIYIKYGRRPWVANFAAQALLGAAGLAGITFLCLRFDMNLACAAFGYLTLIALLSLMGSFIGAVGLSIAAVVCLNFFFTSPLFTLRVEYPDDVFGLAAFLTSALLVTALVALLRKTAEDPKNSRR